MTRWIYPGADLNATAFGERARSVVGDIDSLVKARRGTSSSERNEEVEQPEERPFRPVPADKNLRVGRTEEEEERKLRERKRSAAEEEEMEKEKEEMTERKGIDVREAKGCFGSTRAKERLECCCSRK